MEPRKLPIGIQTFEEIREKGYLYVDKTDLIYQLASVGKPYFLARPRRFGKSLLVSTMRAYFEGRRELFAGLKIAELEKDWTAHPVIHIDFSRTSYGTNADLKAALNKQLAEYEAAYGVTPLVDSPGLRLGDIIKAASEGAGRQAVVLIDEYDKPMLDALQTPDRDANKDTMRGFYGVLKSSDPYLRFLFLTGITKFAKVNIFSELNQLIDISMDKRYSAICGITEEELSAAFAPEIQAFAGEEDMTADEVRAELRRFYDGYHFSRKSPDIYNPFSLLNALDKQEFGSFWFGTATPAMLFALIQNVRYDLMGILDGITLDEDSFTDYRVDGGSLTPIIYHSGYLTIKGYDRTTRLYTLRLPNEEVRAGFIRFLLPLYTNIPEDALGLAMEHFRAAIATGDVDALMTLFGAAVADLPTRRGRDNVEYDYQVVFHAILRQTGYDVRSEVQAVGGRSDVELHTADDIYIFELKMDDGRPWEEVADAALAQIEAKGYAARYAAGGKRLHPVAVVFATERGGLAGYRLGAL